MAYLTPETRMTRAYSHFDMGDAAGSLAGGCPASVSRSSRKNSATIFREITRNNFVDQRMPERIMCGYPLGYQGDDDFLDAFDRALVEQIKARAAREHFSKALEQAFDRTTDSSEMFMPFHWRDVCALNSDETRNWFVRRAEQLSERIAA